MLKRPRTNETTQRIIDHLIELAAPDQRRRDPNVDVTMLVMMRVQRRGIREVVPEEAR